jgi:hypothetical protein
VLQKYGWVAAAVDALGHVYTAGFGVNAPAPAPQPKLILERNSSGQVIAVFERGGSYSSFSVSLGSYQAEGVVEVGRRLLVLEGNTPSDEQLSRILLSGSAAVNSIHTASYGGPDFISVTTPVVDLGQPLKVTPAAYPAGITLEWRASNAPFNAGDATPSWNNPTGEYRYWQVRASTTSISTLIERIELRGDAIALWRRFRSYWQLFESGAGRITKGPFRTVFGSGAQQRTSDGWLQQSDEERNVGDGWL